ncbi:MAG: Holliday junction resolvase RuvX [bacterium]
MSPWLALDYGLRRTGIAVSDGTDTIATALTTHRVGSDGSLFQLLHDCIHERNISGIVLGLPLTVSGTEGQSAQRVREFARKLTAEFKLPIVLVDERFSSQAAVEYMRQGGRRRQAKGIVDAVAAEIILQQHLDSLNRPDSPDGSEPGC